MAGKQFKDILYLIFTWMYWKTKIVNRIILVNPVFFIYIAMRILESVTSTDQFYARKWYSGRRHLLLQGQDQPRKQT